MTKPIQEQLTYLDLIDCLTYMDGHGHPGIKDRLWTFFTEDAVVNNGSVSLVWFPDEDSWSMRDDAHEKWLIQWAQESEARRLALPNSAASSPITVDTLRATDSFIPSSVLKADMEAFLQEYSIDDESFWFMFSW